MQWGLTVSIVKTKGMAVGSSLTDEDVAPVKVEGGDIEMVEQFPYLGSVISKDRDVMEEGLPMLLKLLGV